MIIGFLNDNLIKDYNEAFQKNKISLFIIIILSLSFFFLYYHNLSFFVPLVSHENDLIFHADPYDTIGVMGHGLISFDYLWTHWVFSGLTSPFVILITYLFQTDRTSAIIFVLAAMATINIILTYIALNYYTKKELNAILFSIFYGFLFSNIVFFSIPETYVLINMIIILYFIFLMRFNYFRNDKSYILVVLISTLAPLANPSLLCLIILNCYIYYKLFNFKKAINRSIIGALFTGSIFVISCIVIYGIDFYSKFISYGVKWGASITNFIDPSAIINVIGNFLFCSVIGPTKTLSDSLNFIEEFPQYFDSIIVTSLILFYLCVLLIFSYYAIKNRELIQDCSLAFIFLLSLFYIYFNPEEAILYSSQVLFPLTLIFAHFTDKMRFNLKYTILIIFIILLAINNVGILYAPIDSLDEGNGLDFVYFEGWHEKENWNGTSARWMSDDATLLVPAHEDRNATLKLTVLSFHRDRTVEIYCNENYIKKEKVPAVGFITIEAEIPLREGTNEIRLFVPDGCERPLDIYGSRDERCLSLGVQSGIEINRNHGNFSE